MSEQTEECYHGKDCPWKAAAQPQRSEQQEWTVEEYDNCDRCRIVTIDGNATIIKDWSVHFKNDLYKIADAHNVALTAERQRAEQAGKEVNELNNLLREVGWGQGEIDSAATIAEENESLRQQLFSALAAIHEVLEVVKPWHNEGGMLFYQDAWRKTIHEKIKSVDLSPLHEHDAEVRKPLVDEIEQLKREKANPRD
jgi:hypothetical protein